MFTVYCKPHVRHVLLHPFNMEIRPGNQVDMKSSHLIKQLPLKKLNFQLEWYNWKAFWNKILMNILPQPLSLKTHLDWYSCVTCWIKDFYCNDSPQIHLSSTFSVFVLKRQYTGYVANHPWPGKQTNQNKSGVTSHYEIPNS